MSDNYSRMAIRDAEGDALDTAFPATERPLGSGSSSAPPRVNTLGGEGARPIECRNCMRVEYAQFSQDAPVYWSAELCADCPYSPKAVREADTRINDDAHRQDFGPGGTTI